MTPLVVPNVMFKGIGSIVGIVDIIPSMIFMYVQSSRSASA